MSVLKEKERKAWKWFTTTDMEDPASLSFRQPLTYVSYSQTSLTLSDVFGNYRVFLLVPQCMKNRYNTGWQMSWSARAALYKISEIDENILSEHRLFCHKFKICPDLRAFWELLIEQCGLNIFYKR